MLEACSNDPGYEQVISNYILIYLERTLGSSKLSHGLSRYNNVIRSHPIVRDPYDPFRTDRPGSRRTRLINSI